MTRRAAAVVAFLGLALGVWSADAAIVVHRHGIARPAVAPSPQPQRSPRLILDTAHGGAK